MEIEVKINRELCRKQNSVYQLKNIFTFSSALNMNNKIMQPLMRDGEHVFFFLECHLLIRN